LKRVVAVALEEDFLFASSNAAIYDVEELMDIIIQAVVGVVVLI